MGSTRPSAPQPVRYNDRATPRCPQVRRTSWGVPGEFFTEQAGDVGLLPCQRLPLGRLRALMELSQQPPAVGVRAYIGDETCQVSSPDGELGGGPLQQRSKQGDVAGGGVSAGTGYGHTKFAGEVVQPVGGGCGPQRMGEVQGVHQAPTAQRIVDPEDLRRLSYDAEVQAGSVVGNDDIRA